MRRSTYTLLTPLIGLVLSLTPGAGAHAVGAATSTGGSKITSQDGTVPDADPAVLAERADEALAVAERVLAAPQPSSMLDLAVVGETGREATLALRDLALLRGALDQGERGRADALLARPTDGGGGAYGSGYTVPEQTPLCDDTVCVHRVARSPDRATESYARLVLRTVGHVAQTYLDAGYRPPESDGTRGGSSKTDLYLADLGEASVYGYCTTDPAPEPRPHHTWAYCVLDNDYALEQYRSRTPLENLRVTAAHEYFHAVQFGYDVTEDPYLLEGTATWAEDEVYDDIDDNVGYLRYGPMSKPGAVLDQNRNGLEVYGAWSFFRFLTERFPARQGTMPTVVRDVWRQADAAGDARDLYSLRAIGAALTRRSSTVAAQFTDFSVANRRPARTYAEARANRYPAAQLAGSVRLGPSARTWSARRRTHHLTSHTFRFTPEPGLDARWRLRVDLDLPPARRGSQVRATVVGRDGSLAVSRVALDGAGAARLARGFDAEQVRTVEVTVVNASTRIGRCDVGTAISCRGRALDDALPIQVDARLVRR